MKSPIEFKGFEAGSGVEEQLRSLIEELRSRLEKRARGLAQDPLRLRIVVEQKSAAVHKLYQVSAHLDVPGKVLAARHEGHDPEAVLRETFAELQRELEDYKQAARGEHMYKQTRKRDELRHRKSDTAVVPSEYPETFFSVISPHLERMKEFARHAITEAEARGDLSADEITPEDVVDETVVQAYSEFVKNGAPGDIRAWLLRLLSRQLEREIRQARARVVSIDTEESEPDATPTHEEPDYTPSDDFLDLYQPEQDLNLDEIIPNLEVPSPEDETEAREMRRCIKGAFDSIPKEWRRMLLKHYLYRISTRRLAATSGKAEAEIEQTLKNAKEHLLRKLQESSCGFRVPATQAS